MIRPLWNISIRVRVFMRTYMPTNILLDAMRTRRGLKWGAPAMLIAVPYLLGGWLLTVWIADGGPGWFNLLVLLFIWNALKFLVNGPITLIILIRARLAERRDRRLVAPESVAYEASVAVPVQPHAERQALMARSRFRSRIGATGSESSRVNTESL